jgi:hypothetical protein
MTESNINEEKLMGGKRKNGHKMDCTCHICNNMKNKAKRGGYEEELEKEKENKLGGTNKKNGHRMNCKCPICKNMSRAKKGGNEEKTEDNDKEQMEDNDVDKENNDGEKETMTEGIKKKKNGHKTDCECPICKNMRKSKKGGNQEIIDVIKEEPNVEKEATSIDYENMNGGKRRTKRKKMNIKIFNRTKKSNRSRKSRRKH